MSFSLDQVPQFIDEFMVSLGEVLRAVCTDLLVAVHHRLEIEHASVQDPFRVLSSEAVPSGDVAFVQQGYELVRTYDGPALERALVVRVRAIISVVR
jgi:hypothetical protein